MEHIQYKSFVPSENLRNKAERALDRILDHAPADANINISLEFGDQNFHCKIEIASSSGPFVVESSHKFPPIALDKAELSILRKLDRWSSLCIQPSGRKILKSSSLDSQAS